jgi:hypothetical protein
MPMSSLYIPHLNLLELYTIPIKDVLCMLYMPEDCMWFFLLSPTFLPSIVRWLEQLKYYNHVLVYVCCSYTFMSLWPHGSGGMSSAWDSALSSTVTDAMLLCATMVEAWSRREQWSKLLCLSIFCLPWEQVCLCSAYMQTCFLLPVAKPTALCPVPA